MKPSMSPRFHAATCASNTARTAAIAFASRLFDFCSCLPEASAGTSRHPARAIINSIAPNMKLCFISLISWLFATSDQSMRTRRLSKVTIVAGDSPREENILNFRAAADVMNHHVVSGLFRPDVRDDADVVITIRVPSHDITGQVILMVLSHGQSLTFALE